MRTNADLINDCLDDIKDLAASQQDRIEELEGELADAHQRIADLEDEIGGLREERDQS